LERLGCFGNVASKLIEAWLDVNTNLIEAKSQNNRWDLKDSEGNFYQAKCLTASSQFRFVPWKLIKKPSDEDLDEEDLFAKNEEREYYCRSQVFIVVNIINFPKVEIQLIDGAELLDRFPSGFCGSIEMQDFLLEKQKELDS
jgi:hypothetical protein